ncbi:hypothetical protein RAS12_09040 [Achromobacter seleniivolatilans]|uniref:DUF3592 domain-containing protein n=1 Tax=Achromobacter seleniivolatilans TaxID=3047478 RepID=A0ABY9M6C5_9BURK|nr:hypothetical protein [Achromobacter sp. R39]WMD22505.1 hypothetical protein RAS12_09040 [Achromobacter sp. R39]
MTDNQSIQFPKRPIKVLDAGAAASFGSYLFALLLAFIAVFFIWMQGPGIWRDIQIQRDPVVVEDATLRKAVCKVRKGIFHDCSADISYSVDRKNFQSKVEMSFLTIHSGDWNVDIVRSKSRPELVTLDVGIDMLWNRIAVLFVLVALMLGAAWALLLVGRKNGRTKSLTGNTAEFIGVKAKITKESIVFGKTVINFTYDLNGKAQSFISSFKKGETPFYLGRQEDAALAVLTSTGSAPILLDRSLTRLDLTAEERDALQQLAGA